MCQVAIKDRSYKVNLDLRYGPNAYGLYVWDIKTKHLLDLLNNHLGIAHIIRGSHECSAFWKAINSPTRSMAYGPDIVVKQTALQPHYRLEISQDETWELPTSIISRQVKARAYHIVNAECEKCLVHTYSMRQSGLVQLHLQKLSLKYIAGSLRVEAQPGIEVNVSEMQLNVTALRPIDGWKYHTTIELSTPFKFYPHFTLRKVINRILYLSARELL